MMKERRINGTLTSELAGHTGHKHRGVGITHGSSTGKNWSELLKAVERAVVTGLPDWHDSATGSNGAR